MPLTILNEIFISNSQNCVRASLGIVEFLSPEAFPSRFDKHRAGGLQREFKYQKGEGPKLSDLSAGLFKISGSQWQAGNSCLKNDCGEFSVKLLHQPLGHYDYSLSLCHLRRRQSSQTITTVIQEDTRWARRSLCAVSPCVCVFHFTDEDTEAGAVKRFVQGSSSKERYSASPNV